ncbi:hypothetical protein [Croceibacterium aestuarii]|uniref:hypothetical protein n=1 Tax=Croceibacterium aestuarii TaxID=3064139 RepID=UPI00272ED6A8|nr:hypothetical protein [Croceibacterium sp. D39]
MATQLLLLFAVVFAINLLPAFGPPTWSIIVLFGFNTPLPVPAIVIVGAMAAALGRWVLAHGFRRFRGWLPVKYRKNLEAAKDGLERRRHGGVLALGLFALSPLPSAQLFAAAGLTGVPLLGFTAAFFSGRIVSYSIYAGSAKALQVSSFADGLREGFASPLGIALQVVLLLGLVALVRIDWAKHLGTAEPPDAGGEGDRSA